MRKPVDIEGLREFMRRLGAAARAPGRVYLTGGACAVHLGWRPTTIDVALEMVPEQDELYHAILALEESLGINVEIASPDDFIPSLEGWEARGPFIGQEGKTSFHHYDVYAQALAKIERGHTRDVEDVSNMIETGLVRRDELWRQFESIEPRLYRYPAIDPASFRRAVLEIVGSNVDDQDSAGGGA